MLVYFKLCSADRKFVNEHLLHEEAFCGPICPEAGYLGDFLVGMCRSVLQIRYRVNRLPIRYVTDYTFEITESQLRSTVTEIAPQLAAIFVCELIEVLIFVVAPMLSDIMSVSIA